MIRDLDLVDIKSDDTIKYYPISLDIKDKNCLVIGGGSVGARKVITLLKCGAEVTVVSPVVSEEFIEKINSYFKTTDIVKFEDNESRFEDNSSKFKDNAILKFKSKGNTTSSTILKCIKKEYDINDLDSKFLVISATDNMEVNRQAALDARKKNILCNIADFPEGSSFILPSIVHRGDLVITVSTSGNSPAFSKKIRKELEEQFGQEYADFLIIMGKIRKMMLSQKKSEQTFFNNIKYSSQTEKDNASIFRELVNSDIIERIKEKDFQGVESTLEKILGGINFKVKDFIN